MEKHYAPFVKAPQEGVVAELKGLWIRTGVEKTKTSHQSVVSFSGRR